MCDQQFEDQQAIRALLDRYCDGVNQRTPISGVYLGRGCDLGIAPFGYGRVKRPRDHRCIWLEAMKMFPFVNMMAMPGYIRVEGDTATMRSYTDEVAVMQDGTELRPRGQYDDECVKVSGEWKFSRRVFTVLHGE